MTFWRERWEVHFPSPGTGAFDQFSHQTKCAELPAHRHGFSHIELAGYNRTGSGLVHQMLQRIRESGPPPLGFHLLMGDDFAPWPQISCAIWKRIGSP